MVILIFVLCKQLYTDNMICTLLFQIAEQLKIITEELPKDIREETQVAFMKLFQETSVFIVSREKFRATCAKILVKNHQFFPTGWHQIALIYYGVFLYTKVFTIATSFIRKLIN